MARRKGKTLLIHKDGVGPGNVAKLLGIHVNISGLSLCQDLQIEQAIWIQDEGISVPDTEVKVGPRVGIEYAEEDAFLPFRYQWIKK